MIAIWIDGDPLRVQAGVHLDVLLEGLKESAGLEPDLVAVDARYVPSESWHDVILRDGTHVDTLG